MGHHLTVLSGADPFVIDQTVTVDFTGRPRPWIEELLAGLGPMLATFGGTVSIPVRWAASIRMPSRVGSGLPCRPPGWT